MASPPRRTFKDRIRAMFGRRRRPRLSSLFLDDLPQDHMTWMQDSQCRDDQTRRLTYPFDSSSPSTSAAIRDFDLIGHDPNVLGSPNGPQKSCSFLSLCPWTSSAISPLEMFYSACIAPFDTRSEDDRNPSLECEKQFGLGSDPKPVLFHHSKSEEHCKATKVCDFNTRGPSTGKASGALLNEQGRSSRSKQGLVKGNSDGEAVTCQEEAANCCSNDVYDVHTMEQSVAGDPEKIEECQIRDKKSQTDTDRSVKISIEDNSLLVCLPDSLHDVVIVCHNGVENEDEGTLKPNNPGEVIRIDGSRTEDRERLRPARVEIVGGSVHINVEADSAGREYLGGVVSPTTCNTVEMKGTEVEMAQVENNSLKIHLSIPVSNTVNMPHLETASNVKTNIPLEAPTTTLTGLQDSNFKVRTKPVVHLVNSGSSSEDYFTPFNVSLVKELKDLTAEGNVHGSLLKPNVGTNVVSLETGAEGDTESEGLFQSQTPNDDLSVRADLEQRSSVFENEANVCQLREPYDCRRSETNHIFPGPAGDDVEDDSRCDEAYRQASQGEFCTTEGIVDNFSVADEFGFVDAYRLVPNAHKEGENRSHAATVERSRGFLEELGREKLEIKRLLEDVNKEILALKQEAMELRSQLCDVCSSTVLTIGENLEAKHLETACYRKYLNIQTPGDASKALNLVRNRIKALNDLEVLIYRKQLVLHQVFPSTEQDRAQVSKQQRINRTGQRIPKLKRADQSPANNQSSMANVIIEIVSPLAAPVSVHPESWSKEISSIESPVTVSTLMSASNDGTASMQHLTDTEV